MKKKEKEIVLEALFWAQEYVEIQSSALGEMSDEEDFGLKLLDKAVKSVKV